MFALCICPHPHLSRGHGIARYRHIARLSLTRVWYNHYHGISRPGTQASTDTPRKDHTEMVLRYLCGKSEIVKQATNNRKYPGFDILYNLSLGSEISTISADDLPTEQHLRRLYKLNTVIKSKLFSLS